MGTDKFTFDEVKTNVKLDYITNGNDNFISVVKYIFGKMYYYGEVDDSMKFIFFDELRDAYRLFDVKNVHCTATGQRSVVLSPLKSNAESLITEEPIKLGTVTKFSQMDVLRAFSKKQMFMYSYGSNEFSVKDVKNKELQNYYNERSDTIE